MAYKWPTTYKSCSFPPSSTSFDFSSVYRTSRGPSNVLSSCCGSCHGQEARSPPRRDPRCLPLDCFARFGAPFLSLRLISFSFDAQAASVTAFKQLKRPGRALLYLMLEGTRSTIYPSTHLLSYFSFRSTAWLGEKLPEEEIRELWNSSFFLEGRRPHCRSPSLPSLFSDLLRKAGVAMHSRTSALLNRADRLSLLKTSKQA